MMRSLDLQASFTINVVHVSKHHPMSNIANLGTGALSVVSEHYLLAIPTFPDVPLVVPGLHPHPAAEAERLEGGEAGLGAEVVMADQDADLRKGTTY